MKREHIRVGMRVNVLHPSFPGQRAEAEVTHITKNSIWIRAYKLNGKDIRDMEMTVGCSRLMPLSGTKTYSLDYSISKLEQEHERLSELLRKGKLHPNPNASWKRHNAYLKRRCADLANAITILKHPSKVGTAP